MAIRQAISCDICGAEKKQTNRCFVTSEQGGTARQRMELAHAPARRLQAPVRSTCLHKLVDEFVARNLAWRTATEGAIETRPETDASLTSKTAYVESKADTSVTTRAVGVVSAKPAGVPVPMVLPIQSAAAPADEPRLLLGPLIENVPNYASRRWRAEAWERERALHTVERRNENGTRHSKTL